ncbi:hypothetical protein GCM10020295_44180 [Streptomyces cinereospinus]
MWHSQAWDDTIRAAGQVGFRAFYSAPATTVPFLVHFGDLTVAAPAADTGVIRLLGEVAAWEPHRDRSGADQRTVIEPAGLLRRLSTGQPVLKSLLRRRIPTLYPLAYWPMEEGVQGNTQVADATLTGRAGVLRVSGLDFGQDDTLLGSAPLPQLRAGAALSSQILSRESTGYWSVSMLIRLTTESFPTGSSEHRLLRFQTTGSTAATWNLSVQLDAGSHRMRLRVYDSDGAELATLTTTHEAAETSGDPAATGFLDGWRHIRVRVAENGSGGLDYGFEWRDQDDRNWGNSATLASTSAGRVTRINTGFSSSLKGMSIGHLSVWGVRFTSAYYHTGTEAFGGASSMAGQPGLPARAFLDRLTAQEDVALEIVGQGTHALGPYPAGTVLDLAQQAADTEMGLLTDARHKLSLTYRARDTLYNRSPDLVLDFSQGQVFDPFQPVDDDKDARNQITVSRRDGSEATAELATGRLSVAPPPDGMGPVPTSVETIVENDDQLPGQAAWRLHVATIDRMRVTQLTLEMANPRMHALIDQVLKLDVGSRILITNTPPRVHPGRVRPARPRLPRDLRHRTVAHHLHLPALRPVVSRRGGHLRGLQRLHLRVPDRCRREPAVDPLAGPLQQRHLVTALGSDHQQPDVGRDRDYSGRGHGADVLVLDQLGSLRTGIRGRPAARPRRRRPGAPRTGHHPVDTDHHRRHRQDLDHLPVRQGQQQRVRRGCRLHRRLAVHRAGADAGRCQRGRHHPRSGGQHHRDTDARPHRRPHRAPAHTVDHLRRPGPQLPGGLPAGHPARRGSRPAHGLHTGRLGHLHPHGGQLLGDRGRRPALGGRRRGGLGPVRQRLRRRHHPRLGQGHPPGSSGSSPTSPTAR